MKKKDKVYFTRIIPDSGIFDLCELTIRTIAEDWFVGVDKRDKHAYLIEKDKIEKTVFADRNSALRKLKEAEKIYEEKLFE